MESNKRRSIKPINGGEQGTIFKVEDDDSILIKHVVQEGSIKEKERIPQIVSNLQLYNLIKIYDIKSYKILKTAKLYRTKDESGNIFNDFLYTDYKNVVTYKMENVPMIKSKEHPDVGKLIIDFPLEYIIRNYYTMEETLEELRNNNVIVSDMHIGNFICTEDRIMLIDVDGYDYEKPRLFGIRKKYKNDNRLINSKNIFKVFISEHLLCIKDHDEIMNMREFLDFYNDPNYSFIADIKTYDPSMTLREYLRIKTLEFRGYKNKQL